MHERLHHLDVVIDASEEHRLIAERDAGKRQAFARRRELTSNFLRMVGVDTQPDWTVFTEDFGELRRDALGQEDWDARADADELDVLDRAEASEERIQLGVREQQRVAA